MAVAVAIAACALVVIGVARRPAVSGASISRAAHVDGSAHLRVAAVRPLVEAPPLPLPGGAGAPPTNLTSDTDGELRTPASAKGHRIFVDGRVRGTGGEVLRLRCGPHDVQVGSAGRKRRIVVPCGGSVDADSP
jgi:hypothetical protein